MTGSLLEIRKYADTRVDPDANLMTFNQAHKDDN